MKIGRYAAISIVMWTMLVVGLLGFTGYQYGQFSLQLAQAAARAYFYNDFALRSWVAEHGGVYVPATPSVMSNKYLNVEERDIITPSGKHLTLMNPAYVIRHLNERTSSWAGARGHLTSLKPLRPENGPDEWERKALLSFESGTEEVSERIEIDGKAHLRLMRPMITDESCLRCHRDQGYVLGDIRGGISVVEPMGQYLKVESDKMLEASVSFSIMWLAGMVGILIMVRQLRRRFAERERMAEQLVFARDEAFAADKAKGEFLANMSHELRTPLNGIIGMLKLLRSGTLADEQVEYADIALLSGESLVSIINDLLDYSRVEAGKMQLAVREFNMKDCVDVALAPYADYSSNKGISFSYQVDGKLDGYYWGDEGRLRQILTNVVGNAVKFTEIGAVAVGVWSVGEDEQGERVLFEVSDTGIGIDSERIEYLFEPFTQGDGSSSRHYKGIGMGLQIVRRLVDAMGGTIAVTSELGQGSTFYFTIRFEKGVGTSVDEGVGAIAMRILFWSPGEAERNELSLGVGRMGNRAIATATADDFVNILESGEYDSLLIDGRASDKDLRNLAKVLHERGVCDFRKCNIVVYSADPDVVEELFGKKDVRCCHPDAVGMESLRNILVECFLSSII
ncbi:MAG: DUF3365 domain-containing protein [Pseudodesulfovibrio sp.]|nr:DUF3365 domain-containing protein [Pseudodesulfovibrio sp.]